jgi:hypothetical protein
LEFYRAVDLIPDLFCPSVADFVANRIGLAVINVCELATPDAVAFRLEIRVTLPITGLLHCLREILAVPSGDSLLLFARRSASSYEVVPIDDSRVAQRFATPFLAFHAVRGIGQGELSTKGVLRVSIVRDRSTDESLLLMPESVAPGVVLEKLVSRGDFSPGAQLRLLQLAGARIVRVIPDGETLAASDSLGWRVEAVPPDQAGARTVRVALTQDRAMPRMKCVGTPFLFAVREGETFAETRPRLLEGAGLVEDPGRFGYTNRSSNARDYHLRMCWRTCSQATIRCCTFSWRAGRGVCAPPLRACAFAKERRCLRSHPLCRSLKYPPSSLASVDSTVHSQNASEGAVAASQRIPLRTIRSIGKMLRKRA